MAEFSATVGAGVGRAAALAQAPLDRFVDLLDEGFGGLVAAAENAPKSLDSLRERAAAARVPGGAAKGGGAIQPPSPRHCRRRIGAMPQPTLEHGARK